jgi:hypothetical protein
MEMTEILKAWKRFGRPRVLVNRNTKSTWNVYETDALEEGFHLLSGWIRQRQSQQVIVLSLLLMPFSAYLADCINMTFFESAVLNIWAFILSSFLFSLVAIVWAMPLWTLRLLFPFKWSLLDRAQAETVRRGLYVVILLVLVSLPAIPFVLQATAASILFCILLFVVYLGLGKVDVDLMTIGEG